MSLRVRRETLFDLVAFSFIVVAVTSLVHRAASSATSDLVVALDSARSLRAGTGLYELPRAIGPGWNLNTPPTTLLFLPLSFLSNDHAFAIWTALSLGAVFLSVFWIARELRWPALVVGAALLVSQPLFAALMLGQITGPLMLLVTGAWLAERRDQMFAAGLLLGVAMAVKPFLGLLLVYAVWRRSRSLLAGIIAGGVCTGLAGLLIGGVAAYASWLHALGQISWTGHRLNGSLLGLFTSLLSTTPETLRQTPVLEAPQWVRPAWIAGSAIVCSVGAWSLQTTRNRDRAWCVVLSASLLLSPLGWTYYIPLLVGPLLALATRANMGTRVLLAAAYLCLLMPPAPLASAPLAVNQLLGSLSTLSLLLLFSASALARSAEPAPVPAGSGPEQ